MNVFGGWKAHDVEQHNAKVAKMKTAKRHNIEAGVGEVELKQPLDSSPEIKGKEALDDTLSEEQVKGFGAGGGVESRHATSADENAGAYLGKARREARIPSRSSARPARPSFQIRPTTDEAKLNKTERAFLAWLRGSRPDEPVVGIQNIALKLGDDCRYTPDFWSIRSLEEGMTFWEVKGFWRDDARVKIKVAARQFPWAKFVAVQRIKGLWKFEEIKP